MSFSVKPSFIAKFSRFILDGWESRWTQSSHKDDYGKFELSSGKWNEIKGLKTSQDAKFYALSADHKSFSNKDKTLVVQFTVQHQQKIDCGGGYVKVCSKEDLVYIETQTGFLALCSGVTSFHKFNIL